MLYIYIVLLDTQDAIAVSSIEIFAVPMPLGQNVLVYVLMFSPS